MNIFITGAESTGKSWLAKQLGRHYNSMVVPEFARTYVENLHRDYTFSDLEFIARKQVSEIHQDKEAKPVFYDTGLIITYVWFKDKYGSVPPWFDRLVPEKGKGKYLLCDTDIPWVHDPVRENPERREELNAIYMQVMNKFGFTFGMVKGVGDERFKSALEHMQFWMNS